MDSSEFDIHEGDGFDPAHRKLVEDLEAVARKRGLYLDGAAIQPTPQPGRLAVVASFTVGDLAFDSRLDPDQKEFDRTFRDMRNEAEDAEVERLRQLWKSGQHPVQRHGRPDAEGDGGTGGSGEEEGGAEADDAR